MMHYITQVENRHIVQAGGKNYEVAFDKMGGKRLSCLGINFDPETGDVWASGAPLSSVVLAVQLCLFVREHFKGKSK